MMNDPKGKRSLQAKQEDQNKNNNNDNIMKNYNKAAPSSSTTSRQWSGFRNPRIVRVSRTFGGKDRHSKVSTVRGLRDRRIRLSVPTAIQLYDLQDRLGLSQPSKVIDWLLQVTDDDIEKLPPLQLLPHNGLLNSTISNNNVGHQILNPLAVPWFDVNRRLNEQGGLNDGKGKSIKDRQDDEADDFYRSGSAVLAQKSNLPFTIPGLLNNANYFQHHHQNSEPSSWSLSQFPLASQMGHHMMSSSSNNNGLPSSTTSMPMPSGMSQLLFYPSASVFGPYDHQPSSLNQMSDNNMIRLLSSSSNASQSFAPSNVLVPSLQYSIGSSLRSLPALDSLKFHSQNHNGSSSQQKKDDTGR